MVKSKEYSIHIKHKISLMHYATDRNDAETVNNVRKDEIFITNRNIDNLIDYSINSVQNGVCLEIQAELIDYKNEHFEDKKKTKS